MKTSTTLLFIFVCAHICSPTARATSDAAAQPLTRNGATEYHVSPQGDDRSPGSALEPLKTISAAAQLAEPGDVVTVHQGTYRERINPPRGGLSEDARITYQAAPGDEVFIKGSEIVTGWKAVADGVWKVTLPNSFFGSYNPYKDVIAGDWFNARKRDHHTGEVYIDGIALAEAAHIDDLTTAPEFKTRQLWYGEVDDTSTTLWADFREANPNERVVEINVRDACFYPDSPGRNYITVRGFQMSQAATQWAAPTAEQPALIGTHWSKGWIIEDNVISHSKCVGITLGKDRASGHNNARSADGYNEVVRRALKNGWSKETIGSHIVRNNTIFECGAAGICGSMGAAFSEVTGNHIYQIHIDKPFGGAEQAGIKFHAAIDTLISRNYIHHTYRGIWLDWMTQGTRVTANLLHDNRVEDIFLEVNHGPYVVDNNLFLSNTAMRDMSQGGAFAHNLFAGTINPKPEPRRSTPYHKAHSTEIAGLSTTFGGDNRFYNNIVAGDNGLQVYDGAELPVVAAGNVYLGSAKPFRDEATSAPAENAGPEIRIAEEKDGIYLHLQLPKSIDEGTRELVKTDLLGEAKISRLPYVSHDGTPLSVETDYFGRKRDQENPAAGPFELEKSGEIRLKVWTIDPAAAASDLVVKVTGEAGSPQL